MKNIKDILKERLRSVMDFPIKGINFRDVTSWFADPECVNLITEDLKGRYADKGISKVVCLESRGFVIGSVLAHELGAGIVMARKPGKLPGEVVSQSYAKEYGTDSIEISAGAIGPNDVVLIHDDLIATGGTALAAYDLVARFHPKKIYVCFLIEIKDEGLKGLSAFSPEADTYAMISI
ncbi:MAG: adenine phosphoribosyltransferase [Bacteroidaceae bacterium]